jgi:hypothetical protein
VPSVLHGAGRRTWTATPAEARAIAAEIERVLWNQNHYWELASSLRRAADHAEALAGIDVS